MQQQQYDSEIENVIMSLQDLSVDQLQDSYRIEDDMDDEMEVTSAQSTTDCSSDVKIIGDKIDKKVI